MTTRQELAAACGAVVALVAPTFGQTQSHWANGISGNWNDAAKWTTPTYPNNGSPNAGDTYDAFINPDGAYTVTLNVPIALHDLTFDAAGATLMQSSPLTLSGNLNVNAGTYRLAYSTLNGGNVVVAPGATFNAAGTAVNSTFTGAINVLPDDSFQLSGASQLSNAVVRLGQSGNIRTADLWVGNFPDHSTLAGTGIVMFDGTGISRVRGVSRSLTIDPGITIRTGIGDGTVDLLTSSPTASVINRGVISAQTAGRTITVADTFAAGAQNLGTLEAINGGTLVVRKLGGSAGNLVLSGNSTLNLSGGFSLDQAMNLSGGNKLLLGGMFAVTQPLNVGSGAALTLAGHWSNSAPVTVNGATVTLSSNDSNSTYAHTGTGTFSVSNSTVKFGLGAFPTASVEAYFVNGNTVALDSSAWIDNRGDTLALDATTGSVTLQGAIVQGGTVTTTGGSRFTIGTGGGTFYNVDSAANVLVNSGRSFFFGDNLFNPGLSVNRGTISTTGGTINLIGQWSNQGTISLTNGRLAIAGPATSMGTINVSNTPLDISSSISAAQLASINGTTSRITLLDQGRLDVGGGTITPSAATGPLYLNGGSIANGTVSGSGTNRLRTDGGGSGRYGWLDNITLASDLTLIPGFKLAVRNGLTLANGSRITINNNGDEFHEHSGIFLNYDTQTLGGTGEVVFDGPGSEAMLGVTGADVTIGRNVVVRTGSGSGYVGGLSAGLGYGRITNQGTIRADGAGRRIEFRELDGFAFANTSTGRLEAVNGGRLFFNGNNFFLANWTNEGTIHLDAGNVTIKGQTFTNAPGGRIEGTGTFDVSGTTFVNQGFIAPGLSPGELTIVGNLTQTETGIIALEIGGTESGEFDQLTINGTIALDGLLNIELMDGFVPAESDRFAFLTAAAFTGSFDRVAIVGGGSFDVSTDGGSLVLTNYQVPEPSAALMTTTLLGVAALRRRRRS